MLDGDSRAGHAGAHAFIWEIKHRPPICLFGGTAGPSPLGIAQQQGNHINNTTTLHKHRVHNLSAWQIGMASFLLIACFSKRPFHLCSASKRWCGKRFLWVSNKPPDRPRQRREAVGFGLSRAGVASFGSGVKEQLKDAGAIATTSWPDPGHGSAIGLKISLISPCVSLPLGHRLPPSQIPGKG